MNSKLLKSSGLINTLFGVLVVLILSSVSVGDVEAGEAEEIANIKKVLNSIMPTAQPDSIQAAAIPGMYEAIYGTQVLYVSKDGRYMLEGDLYDLRSRSNLTEFKRQAGRAKIVNDIDKKTMIVFSPKSGEVKHTVMAFTDIDCGYCRKMHKEMPEYNELGIEFRYMAYPRSGVNTPSYTKAVSVWCSDNRQEAMTKSKSGEKLPKKECDNPVQRHMSAAKLLGVSGTPSLVLANGHVIPGYVEPKRLVQILEQIKNN